MALTYGIPQPLRFYEVKTHRNKYLKGGDNDNFRLICPTTRLLPFQIKRDSSFLPLASLKVVDDKTDAVLLDILPLLEENEVAVFDFQNHDIIVHFGIFNHSANLPTGKHYLEASDTVNTWYSETISFVDFDPDSLDLCVPTKIEFWDTCDVGEIFYRTTLYKNRQYKNIFYLDVDIGRPIYEIREEGEEDAFGELVMEYAVSEKKYLLQHVLPQYMLDLLALLPLHYRGEVLISTFRGYTEKVTKITVESDWQGVLAVSALTTITITTDVIIKTACCDNEETPALTCLKNAYFVVATIAVNSDNYDLFTYTDSLTGNPVPLADGDRVLIKYGSSIHRYRVFNEANGSYDVAGSFSNGSGVIDSNQQKAGATDGVNFYYRSNASAFFSDPYLLAPVDSGLGYHIATGYTFKDALVEIWEHIDGADELITIGTGVEFLTAGIQFKHTAGATLTYIVAKGLNCELGRSNSIFWTVNDDPVYAQEEGIGQMEIGSSFIIAEDETETI